MEQNESGPKQTRRVIEAEIISPDAQESRGADPGYQARYGNRNFTDVWTVPVINRDGCLAPAITLGIFLVCLGNYGVLAAIGFAVFYGIYSAFAMIYTARKLMAGQPAMNIWNLRCIGWLFSFFLTIWFAGGFNN